MNTFRKPLNAVITKTVIFLLFVISSCAQLPLVRTVSDTGQWQNRVNRLTEDIINESSALPNSERAIYLALLAKMWWLRDQPQAKGYLRRAVDLTLTSVEFEDGVAFRKEAEHWRRTLYVIASFDEATSHSLARSLMKELKKRRDLGGANADAYIVTALQLVENDPRLAFDLGVKSLNYGTSQLLYILILRLSEKDPKLSRDLVRLAFNSTHGPNRYEFLGDISTVFGLVDGKPLLGITQRGYFELMADLLSSAAGSEDEREARCEAVPLITPWLDGFGRYAPDRALSVVREIQTCVPFFDPLVAGVASGEASWDEPREADDLLRAAQDAGDPRLKINYYYQAISELAQQEKFDEIISVLDAMTDDKKAVGEMVWNSWRIEYAFRAALKDLRENDMQSVYRIIDRTPVVDRPFVRFRIVTSLSPGEYRDFILENLGNIGKELGSLEIRQKVAARGYLSLTRLYLEIRPSESGDVFDQAVKYINKTDWNNPDFLAGKDYAPFRDYVPLPAEMLQYDESSTYSSLSNISSRRSRVRLKLGLLESSLKMLAS